MVERLKKKRDELKQAIQCCHDAVEKFEAKLEVINELIDEEEEKMAVDIEVVGKDNDALDPKAVDDADKSEAADDAEDEKAEEAPHYAGLSRVVIKP